MSKETLIEDSTDDIFTQMERLITEGKIEELDRIFAKPLEVTRYQVGWTDDEYCRPNMKSYALIPYEENIGRLAILKASLKGKL